MTLALQDLLRIQDAADVDFSTVADGDLLVWNNSASLFQGSLASADVVLRDGSVPLTGNLDAGANRLTNLGAPSADGDAATKSYVDGVSQGLDIKDSVRVATTAAGTLATSFENGDTVDGVVLATGDRILLKDQASGIENGIYTVNASGAPTRAVDFASGANVASAFCFVEEGTANADAGFVCTNNGSADTVATHTLTFTQFSGAGSIATKADKVGGAVSGNFAGLDGSGNLTDSGSKSSDFAAASHSHAAADITSGTLLHERGGLEADVSAFDGYLRISGGTTTNIKCNFAAAVAPVATDDSASGFAVGSRWIDTTADKEYVCLDATATSAVWTETTGAGGGGGSPGGSDTQVQYNNGGAFGGIAPLTYNDATGLLTYSPTLDEATGNEIGLNITPTVNKATSGNYTALKVNVTETAAPGSDNRLVDLQVGGTSVLTISNKGHLHSDLGVGEVSFLSIGNLAGPSATSGVGDTLIGYRAGNSIVNGTQHTCIGNEAGWNSGDGVANTYVGSRCNTDGNGAGNRLTLVGYNVKSDGAFTAAIGLGPETHVTGSNQMVAGSGTYPISNLYFGKGVTNATPTAYTLNGTGGLGTNIAGGELQLAGGKGTGTGAGGSVKLQVAPSGVSGSSLNTLVDVVVVAETKVTTFNSGSSFDANGDLVLQSYTNAGRPAAGTAGRIIFNTDDGLLNVDDGTNWTDPDGTIT